MMNNEDLLDDSDSSDEDYVPDTKPNEQLSEVDSDGSVEEPLSDNEETTGRTTKKRKRKTTKSKKKQKTAIEEEKVPGEKEPNEEEKKKKVDDLWADFLKDTGFQSRNSSTRNNEIKTQQKPNPNEQTATTTVTTPTTTTKREDKVKITQIFEFAGEEIKVEKEVSRGSAEARLLNQTTPETSSSNSNNNSNKIRSKGGLSGISNVLSQLGKKPKITTLEKSKLDWDQFKKEENLEEELRTFNKGKDGYLEKQDFLQRADLRRFEIEKEIRSIERSKRLNN